MQLYDMTHTQPDIHAPSNVVQITINFFPKCGDPLKLSSQHYAELTSFGDRAFQHAAPRLWNGLPISLRSANNLNSFKKDLKTFLFKDAYNV